MDDLHMEEELRSLRSDIDSLRSDVAALTDTLRRRSGPAEGLRSGVEEQIRLKREELRRLMETARERSRKTIDGIEEGIGEHPLGSLAAAAGVGFIVGKLLDMGERR